MSQEADNPANSARKRTQNIVYMLLVQFLRENPKIFLVYVLYIIVIILQDIAVPHYSGKIVNAIQKHQKLFWPFITIVGIVLIINILSTVTDWYDMVLFPQMQAFLRSRLVDQTFDKYRQNFSEVDVSILLSKLTKLPYALFGFMDQYRYYIIPQFVVFGIAIAYLMKHDIKIGIALLCVVTAVIYMLLFSPRVCEASSYAMENATNKLTDEMDDVFHNLVTVYSHDQEDFEKNRLDKIQQVYVDKSQDTIKCTFTLKTLMFPLILIFISYFMWRCYYLLNKKQLDTGTFVSLFLMTFYITNGMWDLVARVRDVIPRWGRIKENISILEEEIAKPLHHEDNFIDNKANVPQGDGVYLKDVWYRYAKDSIWVLEGVDLRILPNEKVAFAGRIGSGKTTILKLIMGYKLPEKGAIYLDGIPITHIPVSQLRRKIGYVHQYPILFNRTIFENITYGISNVSKVYVKNMMIQYGVEHIFANQPNGLDSPVGRKGHKLSGGQRQMVWLLRIMLMNPSILVLDEPTASVDDQTRDQIFKMLDLVMQNRTVIIVTHDAKLMKKVDRVVFMKDGKIDKDSKNPHIDPTVDSQGLFMRPSLYKA